ncbi:MAG: hypothetical protein JXB19_12045, partial [Bacteroidales bacterium]|nr:hypothetical protein [Bacteroidales bacterium]
MNKKKVLLILLTGIIGCLNAQQNNLNFNLAMSAGYNGPGKVPFWLRSSQFGSVPPEGASIGLISTIQKDYDQAKAHVADWGFVVEGRFNLGKPSDFILTEGYGKFRMGKFELLAGRSRDIMGLCDTSLTSGAYAVSGNALGIPKIQISIPEFYVLPIFGELFSFKGNYVHGWMGLMKKNADTIAFSETYLHQKSLYVRFGKPDWKLKLFGGLNHQVVWGDEDRFMGEDYALTLSRTYVYVITAKPYNNNNIQDTRIGNHLGSVDLGLEFDFRNIRLMIYRQTFYDAEALRHMANILDGLNGISLVNKNNAGRAFQLKRILFEFLHTKNQGGEVWSKWTPSPYENYFNNSYYRQGWSYNGSGIGTPFINPVNVVKDGFPSAPGNFFINNRVIAIHVGIAGMLNDWHFISKLSYSRNYGTYRTALTGKPSPDVVFPSPYGVFPVTGQFSGYLETFRTLRNGINIGFL